MKKHNKFIAGIMTLCLIGGVGVIPESIAPVVSMTTSAEDYTYENLTYNFLEDGTIEITDCDESATEVVIPPEIDGVPVTSIGNSAFSYCSDLAKIIIPDGVTKIGETTFFSCSNLTEIIIPNGVTSIEYGTFLGCSNLSSIEIPDSLENISRDAFNDTLWFQEKQKENPLVIVNNILIDGTTCEGDIVIPNGVKTICDAAFFQCSNLTSVIIPNSVTSIGSLAFFCCENLTEIVIPDGITSINTDTFYFCEKLASVTLPDSLIELGWEAFIGCKSLKEINIPDSVTYIGYGALAATGLVEVKLPDSITEIAPVTFNSCSDLMSITIPNNVTFINEGAFVWCESLATITILNPKCEIYDSIYTVSNGSKYNDLTEDMEAYFNGTIYGYENSTAQEYAEKYGYKFESLGKAPEKEITATGDLNGDGDFSVSDVVTIQKYLLGVSDLEISDWKQADLNSDGILDIFDLCLMKKKLIEE